MSRRVFISYSRRDKVRATWLRDSLQTFGHEVWIDEVLEGGETWWSAVLEALQWCEIFVAVMTPSYTASEACTKELDYALALHRKLLPVHGDTAVGKAGLRNELSETHWVDIRESNPTAQSDVVRAITVLAGPPALPNPLPPRPTVPISYTTVVRDVLARPNLDRETQEWVLQEIEFRNDRGEEAIDLLELLAELGSHDTFLKALDGRRVRLHTFISEHGVVKGPAAIPPKPQYAPPAPPTSNVQPPPPPAPKVPPPPPSHQPQQVHGFAASSSNSNSNVKWVLIGAAGLLFLLFLIAAAIEGGNTDSGNCFFNNFGELVCP